MATPLFLAKSDFVGEIEIDFGNYDEFTGFAARIEKLYIEKIGLQTYKEIYSETGGIYNILLNGDPSGYQKSSTEAPIFLRGMKEAIRYFFFFHFHIEQQDARTLAGDPQQAYVNMVTGVRAIKNAQLCRIYNLGVTYFNEVIDYMTWKNDTEGSDYYEHFTGEKLATINTFGII